MLSRESYKKSDVKKHLDNLYQACSILGVNEKDVIVGTFKDNSFDSEPLLNLVKFLSNIVNKFKPIYSHTISIVLILTISIVMKMLS